MHRYVKQGRDGKVRLEKERSDTTGKETEKERKKRQKRKRREEERWGTRDKTRSTLRA